MHIFLSIYAHIYADSGACKTGTIETTSVVADIVLFWSCGGYYWRPTTLNIYYPFFPIIMISITPY